MAYVKLPEELGGFATRAVNGRIAGFEFSVFAGEVIACDLSSQRSKGRSAAPRRRLHLRSDRGDKRFDLKGLPSDLVREGDMAAVIAVLPHTGDHGPIVGVANLEEDERVDFRWREPELLRLMTGQARDYRRARVWRGHWFATVALALAAAGASYLAMAAYLDPQAFTSVDRLRSALLQAWIPESQSAIALSFVAVAVSFGLLGVSTISKKAKAQQRSLRNFWARVGHALGYAADRRESCRPTETVRRSRPAQLAGPLLSPSRLLPAPGKEASAQPLKTGSFSANTDRPLARADAFRSVLDAKRNDAAERREERARQLAEREDRLKAEGEARLFAEEARRRAEEQARLAAEEEARLRAEEEVRLRAEEEARLRAEEEVRLRAEEEARLRAEEEARLRAEEEARLRAEEEARLRAEEEARLRAEEEARLRAEKEARFRAEEEARRRSLQEIRRREEEEQTLRYEEQKARQAAERARAAAALARLEARERSRQQETRSYADHHDLSAPTVLDDRRLGAQAGEPPRPDARYYAVDDAADAYNRRDHATDGYDPHIERGRARRRAGQRRKRSFGDVEDLRYSRSRRRDEHRDVVSDDSAGEAAGRVQETPSFFEPGYAPRRPRT